jgi:hypothetical protein
MLSVSTVLKLAATMAILGPLTTPAFSQSASLGCTLQRTASGHTLRCQNGVTIQAERTSRYSLIDRNGDGLADGVRLRQKGLLLDARRRLSPRSGFVVVTPQAIAAVRGTKWAVDVQGRSTAVFVVNGVVSVEKTVSGDAVSLRAGQGVDVDRSAEPVVIKRWPAERVAALLGRFRQ